MTRFKSIERLIQAVLSAIILVLLLRMVDLETLVARGEGMQPGYLAAALAVLPLSLWVRAYRWQVILAKGGHHLRLGDLYLLTLVGITLNFMLPAGSGDVARSYFGYRRSGLREEMLSSSLADKVVALLAVFLLGITPSLALGLYAYAGLCLGLALGLSAVILYPWLLPWGWLRQLSAKFLRRPFEVERLVEPFTLTHRTKLYLVALSGLGWLATYLILYLIGLGLRLDVSLMYVLFAAPLITLGRLFPLTLNGIGSQEAVVVYFWGLQGVTSADALLASLLFSLITLVLPGLVGLAVIVAYNVKSEERAPNNDQ